MKYLVTIILLTLTLLIPFNLYSQTQTYNVNVRQQKTIGESFNDGLRAGAAARAARATEGAAQSAALANNSIDKKTDLLINNDGIYKAVVVNSVSGWKPSANKSEISKILRNSKKYHYFRSIKDVPVGMEKSDELLFLDWIREAVTQYDRVTTMVLKNSNGEIVYEATHKNIPYSEMLSPLMTTYEMNRDDAIAKIKELKELLDMGVLTQSEFQQATQELKKVILN
tara:strand:- start:61 stop:738 length:678 start_codon:yes stop_codon:yes gene_type:complete